jgi:hypothetical protein
VSRHQQQDKDCYGAITLPYLRTGPATWSSSDTETATVGGSGGATAVGAGETTIQATWMDYRYDLRFVPCSDFSPGAPQCYNCEEPAEVHPSPSAVLQVRPRITITRNGSAITSTQNVIVGQQMSLAATVRGGTPTSQEWTIPGNRVANYEVVCSVVSEQCQEPTSATVTPLTMLNNSTVSYCWVDGADNRQVRYAITIRGRQYSRAVTFNVKRPTAEVSTSTGAVQLTAFPSGYGLWFGNPTAPGIVFTRSVTMPSSFNGDLQWVQTWNKLRRVQSASNNRCYRSEGTGLDTLYPYSSGTTANDSPGLTFDGLKAVIVNESFQMWLMFKPTGVTEPTIWVPLRIVNWNWAGDASLNGATWVLNSSSRSVNPADADTTTHPTWSRNAASIGFTLEP